jgi:hypothetical protein
MKKYKVKHYEGTIYQVVQVFRGKDIQLYIGSLLECEAFLRLKESGKIE